MQVKLWSEGYECTKKGIFWRTEASSRRPNHVTPSLWGVTAKWPTRAPKTKLILCPRDPQGYSRISFSLPGRILKEYRYSMGFAKSHSLKCSLHKWAWCGAARKSARLSCINLIYFNLHCGSTARELVHCYTWGCLRIVTVRGKTVGWHS